MGGGGGGREAMVGGWLLWISLWGGRWPADDWHLMPVRGTEKGESEAGARSRWET